MIIPLSKRQRVAVLVSDCERDIPSVRVEGYGTSYRLEWQPYVTKHLLARLRGLTPEHEARAIPYKTLINKIIVAHRQDGNGYPED